VPQFTTDRMVKEYTNNYYIKRQTWAGPGRHEPVLCVGL